MTQVEEDYIRAGDPHVANLIQAHDTRCDHSVETLSESHFRFVQRIRSACNWHAFNDTLDVDADVDRPTPLLPIVAHGAEIAAADLSSVDEKT